MPYDWVKSSTAPEQSGAVSVETPLPHQILHLWPHRSLPLRGFVGFIALTSALVALPLLALLGSPILWGILPFIAAAITALYLAFLRNYRDGALTEEYLELWEDRVRLTRHSPRQAPQVWEANPHWVRVSLHEEGGPVPSYVTLKGNGREVEIGAFLSPEERQALARDLRPLFGPR